MKLNHKLRNLILSSVLLLILILAVLYLYKGDMLYEGLKTAKYKQTINDVKFQLAMVFIICPVVGIFLLNTKLK